MTDINVGDKVVCIEESPAGGIEVGVEYEVYKTYVVGTQTYIRLRGEKDVGYRSTRFQLASEDRSGWDAP